MKAAAISAAVAIVISFSGCASILSGQTDYVEVDSVPQGKVCRVYQGGEMIGEVKTPQTLPVERTGQSLLVACEGGERERETAGINGWTLANLFLLFPLGIVGMGVDWATGASSGYDDVTVGAGAGR